MDNNITKIKNPNPIKLSTVANFWWYGFITAILIIMIFNLISQKIDTIYYRKIFCNI